MSYQVDVLVVGAGPAGCAAALTAKRAGLTVLVVDKAVFPRDKTCGDGLTTMALEELARLGVGLGECKSQLVPSYAMLRSPSGRQTRLPLQDGLLGSGVTGPAAGTATSTVAGLAASTATSPAAGLAASTATSTVAIATRGEVDFALVQAVRDAGIELLEGVKVEQIELGASGCRVHLSGGVRIDAHNNPTRIVDAHNNPTRIVDACHVIAADGVYSSVRKLLGIGPSSYLGEWHAARQYRKILPASGATASTTDTSTTGTNKTESSAHDLWVWFEPDILPGYVWSFPLADGIVNFGFCAQRIQTDNKKTNGKKTNGKETSNNRAGSKKTGNGKTGSRETGNKVGSKETSGPSGRRMAEIWRSLLKRPHIAAVLGDSEPCGPQRAWSIPAKRLGEMPLAYGPVLFCGDAAALADPMTGEGIGQALLTGRLAAEAVAESIAESIAESMAESTTEAIAGQTSVQAQQQELAQRYESAVKSAIGADLKLARLLSSALTKQVVANSAVRLVGVNNWTRRKFGRWLFEAYPRALLATPRRWPHSWLRNWPHSWLRNWRDSWRRIWPHNWRR